MKKRIRKKAGNTGLIIGVILMVLATAAGVIAYQMNKISTFRHTAQNIFYDMKSLELQISKLEDTVRDSGENLSGQ